MRVPYIIRLATLTRPTISAPLATGGFSDNCLYFRTATIEYFTDCHCLGDTVAIDVRIYKSGR
ncbi:hypothetical protein AG1IA_07081 [Rhizoctonia solani AG-1 IA]|uniref:Uncharacterized protein n=1 Tax=Thanatephorus cucumeris (strain AG1-IA) TaxID=983506 RepID=L8WLR6_THACA|nr:hypothetical protein AG1IA_07081 [Rhizoctonia solani AG-1 IA]